MQDIEMIRYQELERLTGLSRSTLTSKVCRGEIPHYRLGRRLVVFSRTEIIQWLEARHRDVGATAGGNAQ